MKLAQYAGLSVAVFINVGEVLLQTCRWI